MKVEKYWNEKDEMAVLVSPNFGSGWSTTNGIPELAYDSRIIEAYLDKYTTYEIEEYCEALGYENVYAGGWRNCVIKWIPKGSIFYIREYDGAEDIITEDKMIKAED